MSRFGGPRGYDGDLAYGDSPQRWDRDRFERMGRGPTSPRQYEEDYRYQERDAPGRRDIAVADRIDARGPRGRYEERDRFYEHDRLAPGPRRRTDRELFGDSDPREYANMAMTPYRAKSTTRRDNRDIDIDIDIDQRRGNSRRELDIDIDIDQRRGPPARPGLLRRQSSLDTFDRRGPPRHGYEREDYRMPAYTPVPLPIRKDQRFNEYDEFRYEPEDYREVEIQRERSVHRHRPKSHKSAKSSRAKSVTTRRSSSSSSSSSFVELQRDESIHGGSVHETIDKRFKKGKTRMPKRLVRCEAIRDLGYPYDEETDFFVLRIALEKEQIDEVMRISESYKSGEKKTVYEYKEKIDEAPVVLPPPPPEVAKEHEEIVRTEWINPPSVAGARSHRSVSHSGRHYHDHSVYGGTTPRALSPARTERTSRTSRSRRRSSPGPEFYERKTVIEESNAYPPPPPPPAPVYYEEDRKTQIVEERRPMSPPSSHGGALIVQEREYRSDRDINAEIAKLEAERRALRLEREAEERRDMAIRLRERPEEEYQLVEYRDRPREVLEVVERERSPPRNVLRVEKDRKGRMAMVRSKH